MTEGANPPKHLSYRLLILRQKLSIPSTSLGMVRGIVSSSNHNPEPAVPRQKLGTTPSFCRGAEGLIAKADGSFLIGKLFLCGLLLEGSYVLVYLCQRALQGVVVIVGVLNMLHQHVIDIFEPVEIIFKAGYFSKDLFRVLLYL